jgi:hypothetical protein
VESIWFKCAILHLRPQVVFLLKKQFSHEILLKLVEEMKQVYVLPKLRDCIYATTSFELWMSNGAHDIFALVINFLRSNSEPIYKLLLGCLKNINYWLNLGYQINKIVCSIWIEKKNIAYVRYKGLNLMTMITSLKLIIKCEILHLNKSFQGICFGHFFFKAC